jgi:lauroyl/myristoyl acyltransferase
VPQVIRVHDILPSDRGDVRGMIRRELRADASVSQTTWHAGRLNNGLIFSATYHGVTWLPGWCSHAIGHAGTWLAYHLMRSGTRALIENLRCVRPAASENELRRLALLTYRSYARDTIDFIRALSKRTDLFGSIQTPEVDRFSSVIAQGHGVIVIGGHFGNWELGGLVLRSLSGLPMTVVGRPEPSPIVGELRRRMRESFGIESVDIGHSLETALRLRRILASNGLVAMLIDRHVGRDRIEVSFFGRRTFFLRTPALIASLSGAPLVPASMIRQPDGRFVGWLGEPVLVEPDPDSEQSLRRATQAIATQLEQQIRQYPQLWYQFYPYWEGEKHADSITGSSV